jgi:GGDEF domain-containing protein
MLSLRKLMEASGDVEDAMRKISLLLVEAVALNATDAGAGERDVFQRNVRRIGDRLGETRDPQIVLSAAEDLIQLIEAHHAAGERFRAAQAAEFLSIIRLLTSKLIGMADSSDASRARLAEIDANLTSASGADDLKVLRLKLEESLVGIRQEASRQARQATDIRSETEQMQERIVAATGMAGRQAVGIDPITGLPDRLAAELALQRAVRREMPHNFAAMFSIQRLLGINQRFGFAAGDTVLHAYAWHVAQQLSASDMLYRWRGPSLLAFLKSSKGKAVVSTEIRRICGARFEHSVELDGKSVLLAVPVASLVLELTGDPEAIGRTFDQFTSAQSGEKI